ncbi:MAG TPA: hypothetical protein VH639_27010 [Bryobacteraceae bacterium]
MAKTKQRRYTARVVVKATPELRPEEVFAASSTPSVASRSPVARWLYPASIWLCVIICICHVLSLTLVINFDGNWYVQLADMLGTKRFPGEWDFLRTPLFPAMLKIVFGVMGRQALSVIGLQTALACAGIWLLGRFLRRIGRPIEASIGVVLVSAYPTLIAYEHALLTEVGSFLFLTLLVYALVTLEPMNVSSSIIVALAISAGYYFRSSLLYLAPLAAGICALKVLKPSQENGGGVKPSRLRRAGAVLLITGAVPFILAYPWQRYPKVSERNGHVLLFGLVKQDVLPPDDPILSPSTAAAYDVAVGRSLSNEKLPYTGIQNGREWSVIGPIYHYGSTAGSIFLRVIRTHPRRYLDGVERNLILYSGFGGFANDNAILRNQVLYSYGRKIDPGPEWFPPLGVEFQRNTVSSITSRLLLALSPVYDWLVLFAFVATVLTGILAIWRLDTTLMAFTLLPLAFILLHAILLMSQDRMALPTYPILLINLVMFPARVNAAMRRGALATRSSDVPI